MTHALDIEALRKRFTPTWKAYGETTVTVLYDNDRAGEEPPAKFIRFSVRPSGIEYTNLGGDRTRAHTFGRVWMQVAVPIGAHANDAWKLADKAAAIFRRWRSETGDLFCKNIETDLIQDTKHYIVNVKVSYEGRHYT